MHVTYENAAAPHCGHGQPSRGSGNRRWDARRWWPPPASLLGLWVVLHVAGNLTLFSGPAAADGYAAALRRTPAALWAVRAGLAVAAGVHVAGVVSLARAGAGRPATPPAAGPARGPRWPRGPCGWAARCCSPSSSTTCCTSPSGSFTRAFSPATSTTTWCGACGPPGSPSIYVGGGRPARPPPLPRPLGGRAQSRGLARGRGPAGGVPRWPWSRPRCARIRRRCPSRCSPVGCDDAGALLARDPLRPARWPRAGRATGTRWPWSAPRGAAITPCSWWAPGLAGASAAATLVRARLPRALPRASTTRPVGPTAWPRRAGSTPRKNYQNDGDSVERLFHDTLEGGDFRSREANVYRLAELSTAHHRPRGGPGRALRPRVRRPPRQSLVRRRAGLAHVLRARANRPAAPARSLPRAREGGGGGQGDGAAAAGDARSHRGGRAGARGRRARPGLGRPGGASGRRGGAGHRRLRERLLPVHEREGLQRHRDLAGAPARGGLRQSRLRAVPSHVPSRGGRAPGQAHPHVGVAPERRAPVGAAPGGRRARGPRPSPRRSATTSSSAATRATATSSRATSARARARPWSTRAAAPGRAAGACTWTSPTRRGGWAPTCCASATATSSSCTSTSPATIRSRGHAHRPRRALLHGRPLGGLRPHEHDPGALRHRRGELLGPGREPPRRQRPDAGAGRRLLHPALHAGRLPRRGAAGRRRRGRPGGARGGGRRAGARGDTARPGGPAHRDPLPPRAGPRAVGGVRDRAQPRGARQGDRRGGGPARGVLAGPGACPGRPAS